MRRYFRCIQKCISALAPACVYAGEKIHNIYQHREQMHRLETEGYVYKNSHAENRNTRCFLRKTQSMTDYTPEQNKKLYKKFASKQKQSLYQKVKTEMENDRLSVSMARAPMQILNNNKIKKSMQNPPVPYNEFDTDMEQ